MKTMLQAFAKSRASDPAIVVDADMAALVGKLSPLSASARGRRLHATVALPGRHARSPHPPRARPHEGAKAALASCVAQG
jgi:hypothetical protein